MYIPPQVLLGEVGGGCLLLTFFLSGLDTSWFAGPQELVQLDLQAHRKVVPQNPGSQFAWL